MKGKLITIYGINNVGKSTQSKLLVESLEKAGHKVKYLKYPIYDLPPTGPFLNGVLRQEQAGSSDASMLQAEQASGGAGGDHVRAGSSDASIGAGGDKQEQKISEDELQLWFILNRYQFEPELKKFLEDGYVVVAEDYVGTGIAWGMAKGLEQEWLEEANKFLLKEDLAIFINGERDHTVIEKIHLHEQNPELMEKCAAVLKALAGKYGWKVVDRRETMEETAGKIWEVVEEYLHGG